MRHATVLGRLWPIGIIAILVSAAFSPAVASTGARGIIPSGSLVITPADGHDFGGVVVGDTSAPVAFTITAPVDESVEVGTPGFDGVDPADFAIASDDCPEMALLPGQSCSIGVTFSPQALGTRSATLVINAAILGTPFWLALSGVGTGPASGVTWSARTTAGPAHSWNGAGALARTVDDGSQRLHLAYATDRVGGHWAKDSGPHVGVYYTRGSTGATWSTPKRLNPSTQHASVLGLAAAGSRVYVTWASHKKWSKYSPSDPRTLYVRVNTDHGASGAWKKTIRLSSTSGRVDYPTIAAAGDDVFVAWTNADTGKVMVTASHNKGKTWKTTELGTTKLHDKSGSFGMPTVAADGSTAIVVWVADGAGVVRGRVSSNHGSTWAAMTRIGSFAANPPHVAVRGSRIAVTWTTEREVVLRQREAGTWGDPVTVATLHGLSVAGIGAQDTLPGPVYLYGPAVALQDDDRVAVSWTQTAGQAGRWDLQLAESADGGEQWYQPEVLGSSSSTDARTNDWASMVWAAPDIRLVVWNGWAPRSGRDDYRLFVRTGTGIPDGPTVTAVPWSPSGAATGHGPATNGRLVHAPR